MDSLNEIVSNEALKTAATSAATLVVLYGLKFVFDMAKKLTAKTKTTLDDDIVDAARDGVKKKIDQI